MKKYSCFLVLLFTLGSRDIRKESSAVLYEDAVVDGLIYSPSHHSSRMDVGITTGGNLSLTPTSVSIPERHGVVFKCQHGKFYIESKSLWQSLSQGDRVVIEYQELFKVEYKDGKEISRELYDLDFLSAVIVNRGEFGEHKQ